MGNYVNTWAARIFSDWITPVPVVGETNDLTQRPRKHVPQELGKKMNPAWSAVLQDMDSEVGAFKSRKHEWSDTINREGDMEMINVDAETQRLEGEILHLRHRYNLLGDSAFNHHPGIGIKFFTEEELHRPDLPSAQQTRPNQATVRNEAPILRGSYPPSPPREVTSKSHSPPSNASPTIYGNIVEHGDSESVVIDSKYGFIYVPTESGQIATNDTTNESTNFSSGFNESDESATEDDADSDSEIEEFASGNNHNNNLPDALDPTLRLQYPELPGPRPTLFTLPAHLFPAPTPRSQTRPTQIPGRPLPTKNPTGTADAFDQRRALLRNPDVNQIMSSKVEKNASLEVPGWPTREFAQSRQGEHPSHENNSVTEKLASSKTTFEKSVASMVPAEPEITVVLPSNSSRSSSTNSIDLDKLLPPSPVQTRRKRGGSERGQKPRIVSTSTTTTDPAKPSQHALATGTSDGTKTTKEPQKTSPNNIFAAIITPSPIASNTAGGDASETVRKLTNRATTNGTMGPAKPSSFPSNNGSGDATEPAQKPGPGSSIPGLGNSILGKRKTTLSHKEASQSEPALYGKQHGTFQDSDDTKKRKKGSSDQGDAVVYPECTFANPPNSTSCEMCEAKFVEDMSGDSKSHIPGASSSSKLQNGDVEMQDAPSPRSPVSDELFVIYDTPASLNPTDPDHYATGAAGPRGTLGPHGNPLPISSHEADRLARVRRNTPRGPRGVPYFNEQIKLKMREQREYAEIQAWEAKKQERLQARQEKWDKLQEEEKQKKLQKLEQERQIKLEMKAAAEAEAEYGSGFWKMSGLD